MNRYILVILVVACVAAVTTRLMAAEPEPIPSDAIKALVDRVNQIAGDKNTTSAQKEASQEKAVNEFRTKYDGRTVSLRYAIEEVKKGNSYPSNIDYFRGHNCVRVNASDSQATYKVGIVTPHSTMMKFGTLKNVEWNLPEKDILSLDKTKDRLLVTVTLTDKTSPKPAKRGRHEDKKTGRMVLDRKALDGQVTVGFGEAPTEKKENQPSRGHLAFSWGGTHTHHPAVSLLFKDATVKIVSGDDATGKPEGDASKP